MSENRFLSLLFARSKGLKNIDLRKLADLVAFLAPEADYIDSRLLSGFTPDEQEQFIQWILLRWAGVSIVPPEVTSGYIADARRFSASPFTETAIAGKTYRVMDYTPQGAAIRLIQYDWVLGMHDIYYRQYECPAVNVRPGDTVIDAGAFIGDTAVLFQHIANGKANVHSFDIFDENMVLYRHNMNMNKISENRATINKLALSDKDGETVFIKTNALAGATMTSAKDSGISIKTTTLDTYVAAKGLSKVDFIKMDIEGDEPKALRGAAETIRKHHPRMAICIYHNKDDLFAIPKLIDSFTDGYRFHFKWVHKLKGWEAVLLCEPLSKPRAPTKPVRPVEGVNEAYANLLAEFRVKFDQAASLWAKQKKES